LHTPSCIGTMDAVDERDTVIVMETLFDIRSAVYHIHDVVFPLDDEDDNDAEEETEDDS
jgi:hypothetical protein